MREHVCVQAELKIELPAASARRHLPIAIHKGQTQLDQLQTARRGRVRWEEGRRRTKKNRFADKVCFRFVKALDNSHVDVGQQHLKVEVALVAELAHWLGHHTGILRILQKASNGKNRN